MPDDYGQQWSALGYNVDFSNYNPSAPPDLSDEAFYKVYSGGKDYSKRKASMPQAYINEFNAWATNLQNQFNEYKNWYDRNFELQYNSESAKLARLRAIGQNPYYTDQLGSQASINTSAGINTPERSSTVPEGLSIFSEIAQSALSLVGQIANISSVQDSNALTQQKTIKQALENRWQAHQMGIDLPAVEGSLLPNIGQLSDETLGLQGTKAGKQWNKVKFGPQHGQIFDQSYQGYMSQYILSGMHANEMTANYKLENILPYIKTIYENESVLSGISKEQAQKINEIYDKYVSMVDAGYDYELKKLKMDLKFLGMDRWIDAASKLIGAGAQLHTIVHPYTQRGQLPSVNLGGFTYGNSTY